MWTNPSLFVYSAILLYAGLIALAIDIGFEFRLKSERSKRYLGWAGIAVLLAGFTFGIVLYPATLGVSVVSFAGKYDNNEPVYGIPWKYYFSDLRVELTNQTDRDFENLDITIHTYPLLIQDQKQITNLPNVSFIPRSNQIHEIFQDTGKEANLTELPHDVLRVLCARVPKHGTLSLILAVSDTKTKPSAGSGVYLMIPQSDIEEPWLYGRPTKAKIELNYSVFNRPFSGEKSYPVAWQ